MKICSARNFLILFLFLVLYYFVLDPAINWYNRDKQHDLYNVYQKSDILQFDLFYCHLPKRSASSKMNCTKVWVNDSIPYLANKFLLNKTFEIPIAPSIRENLTNLYLLLRIKQRNCKENCIVLQQTSQILKWFLPPKDSLHHLVSVGPKPTPKPSPTPIPYRYRTTRFDLLEQDIINSQIVYPWVAKHLTANRRRRQFQPIFAIDDFFDIPSERRMINMSNPNFTVNVEINIRKNFIWNTKLILQFSFLTFNEFDKSGSVMYNFNYMKQIFIGTSPVLLWATGIAFVLHFIFQVLAFEKDIEFWAKKDSLIGVSLRSILLQLGSQLILFFNIIETKRIPPFIKIVKFLEILLQLWKTMKLMKLSKRFPFFKVRKEYRGETDDADAVGFKYLSYALVPLLIGYSVYQLIYSKYKNVRSYVLHCLSGAVYSFGFLAMLPQLYVNYKLKTVAGMSKSAFAYKVISTFIDDLYTFVTDLPLMYKIACFRDDVVFFIWVFQCFIYPVDPTRVNEYGYVEKSAIEENLPNNEEEEEEANEETKNKMNKLQDNNEQKLKTD